VKLKLEFRPERGFFFTAAEAVCITAMINHIFKYNLS